jgi:hypothetical protein
LLSFSALFSQQNPNKKSVIFKVTSKDTLVDTGDRFIIQFTDVLKIDKVILNPNDDYSLDYRQGVIKLNKDLFSKYSLDTNRIYDLIVEYDLFPYNFKDEYSNFDIILEKDTLTGDTIQIAVQKKDLIENLFEGTDLEKSGSLFRGFTFGSNRDVTLNSGFRLQLNGKLAKDVDIVAALTDESTPIQPEGNTQKLQELDKVFIELKSNNITTTIGDINIDFEKSEFVNFNRKIQGAKGFGEFNFGNLLLTGAVSRGKFNTNSFNGIDGVQGPYRLIGADNETNILVLSGTEEVDIDGIKLTRGDQADYVIDYGIGEITFTEKKIITNVTRIVVDFEYSERRFSRTLLAGNNTFKLFDNKLNIGISYVNEFDSKDKTIDFTLSDEDKEILRNAGNNKLKAVKSGVTNVGRDSIGTGLGSYKKIIMRNDTGTVTLYKYAPGDENAIYNVAFSFVGAGNGNYNSISTFKYDFVGLKQGSYDTVVFIPIPTSYQVANITLDYSPDRNRDFYVSFESAYSYFNQNLYSDRDSRNNGGVAFFGIVGLRKSDFNLLGIEVNNLDINFKERVINKLFNSLDRINSVEFNRNFNVQDSSKVTEELMEGNLSFSPGELINLKGNFGQLKRGDFFNSNRTIAKFEFNPVPTFLDTSELPQAKYEFELIDSEDRLFNNDGKWVKHYAYLGYNKFLGKDFRNSPSLVLNFEYIAENKKSSVIGSSGDSLTGDSFAFDEMIPGVYLNNFLDFDLFAEFNYRKDRSVSSGELFNLSDSYTQRYGISYKGLSWFSTLFDISIRDRLYSDVAQQLGNSDNNSVLINSRTRIDPFNSAIQTDLFYNIVSERTAKIEKLFVLVPVGEGNYIYLGDLNNNSIQDENEFQLVNFDGNYIKLNIPTDEFFPTVDLKTFARIYMKPSRYFNMAGNSFFADVINNFTSETSYRIEEKSKDPNTNNLYFLRFNTFLNDSNTLSGTQIFQQDFNFFENNQAYSFRLRFLQTKGFSQFSSGNERLLNIQRSARLKIGLTDDITTQIEYANKTDKNTAPLNSIRNRDILSDEFLTDIAYRPIPEIESGLQFNFTRATDFYPKNNTGADINQQILRFIYSFVSVGRLRVEFERDEVLLSTDPVNLPYELTNGRVAGKSYFWRALLDYSISKNIQASVNYNGRVEGGKKVIHSGNAQVTAFF